MNGLSAQRSSAIPAIRRAVDSSWLPWVGFAAIAAHAVHLLVIKAGAGLTFFYDEWEFLLRRRGHSPEVFLRPHSEHLSAAPIAVYKGMLQIFGLHYRPFQWMLMIYLLALAVAVYLFARPRVGPWVALMPVLAILWGGRFWEDTMWPFQIGFIGSLTCGVFAFIALDRRSRRGDIVACVLLILGIAHSSVGLPFLVGFAVELAWRRDWRRLWVVAVPVVLYAAWKVAYPVSDFRRDNIGRTPGYVVEAAAGATGSIFDLPRDAGKVLMYASLGLLVEACLRRRSSIRLWSVLLTALAFWAAAGLARAQLGAPDVSRYLLPGATLILVAAVEAARGVRVNRVALLVLAALIPILLSTGRITLYAGIGTMTTWSGYLKDEYKALELIDGKLRTDPAGWQLDPQRAPDITVGSYYGLTHDFGSPAPSFAEALRTPPEARSNADAVMLLGTATKPAPSAAPTAAVQPPPVVVRHNASATPDRGCVTVRATGTEAPYADLAVPRGGILFRPSGALMSVGLRLLGDDPYSFGRDWANRWFSLVPPAVSAPRPWMARFDLATAPVRVCGR